MSTDYICRAVRIGERSAVGNTCRARALDVDKGVQEGNERLSRVSEPVLSSGHGVSSSQAGESVGCSTALR